MILYPYINTHVPIKENLPSFAAFLNDCGAPGAISLRGREKLICYAPSLQERLAKPFHPVSLCYPGEAAFDEGLLAIEKHIHFMIEIAEGVEHGARPNPLFLHGTKVYKEQAIGFEYPDQESWLLQPTFHRLDLRIQNFTLEDYIEICGIIIPLSHPDGVKELRRMRRCQVCNKYFSSRGKAPYCSEKCRSKLNYTKLKEKKTKSI
jgi:predicted nucleic acid-binding Zn ribbon protein